MAKIFENYQDDQNNTTVEVSEIGITVWGNADRVGSPELNVSWKELDDARKAVCNMEVNAAIALLKANGFSVEKN